MNAFVNISNKQESPAQHQNILETYSSPVLDVTMTNPRDAKACRKSLQFDVLTTLSLTILAYFHSLRPKSAKSGEIH